MSKNIVDTARDAGAFTTLVTAIEGAGLEATLAGDGPFTVFAPNDEAFEALPAGAVAALLAEPAKLAKVLTYHVVPGRVSSQQVAHLTSAPTVNGEDLRVTANGGVQIDGAHVLSADIEAANGVIHVIDRVLMPSAL